MDTIHFPSTEICSSSYNDNIPFSHKHIPVCFARIQGMAQNARNAHRLKYRLPLFALPPQYELRLFH
jgi:hypothetical protein